MHLIQSNIECTYFNRLHIFILGCLLCLYIPYIHTYIPVCISYVILFWFTHLFIQLLWGLLCTDISCTTLGSNIHMDCYVWSTIRYVAIQRTLGRCSLLSVSSFGHYWRLILCASSLWLYFLPSAHFPGIWEQGLHVFSCVGPLHKKPQTLRQS